MVKFEGLGKKKRFDEDSEWVPSKGRVFTLKGSESEAAPTPYNTPRKIMQEARPKDVLKDSQSQIQAKVGPVQGRKPSSRDPITHAEGLDRAYASSSNLATGPDGTVYVSGTKGGLLGREWMENYFTMGVPLVVNALGGKMDYPIEDNERYNEFDQYMAAHASETPEVAAHSKGSAVVERWQKNHPEWKGQIVEYSTPTEDIFGKQELKDRLNSFNALRNAEYEGQTWKNPVEKWLEDKVVDKGASLLGLDQVKGLRERNVRRIAGDWDPAAMLDASAERVYDPDWYKKADKGFGHDYHYIANRYSGSAPKDRPGGTDPNYRSMPDSGQSIKVSDSIVNADAMPLGNTVKTTWDSQPFNPLNTYNLIYDRTEGEKITS